MVKELQHKIPKVFKYTERLVLFIKKLLWLIESIKCGLQNLMLEIFLLNDAPQSSKQIEVDCDQLKTFNLRDSQHSQNIQIEDWKSFVQPLCLQHKWKKLLNCI